MMDKVLIHLLFIIYMTICQVQGDIQVNLVNGNGPNSGRVEIIRNGVRGTICDDGWSNKSAAVVCRILGFSGGQAKFGATFGAGSGAIWLDDVKCHGNESSLMDCSSRPWGVHNCDHSEDAGVICEDGETAIHSDIAEIQGAKHYGCPKESEPFGVCRVKNDHGTCTDYVVKWFYNSTAGRCERFWYGGCGGNDNRFDEEESCSRRCGKTGPDTDCQQSSDSGRNCEVAKLDIKWYYNRDTGHCDRFWYRGCGGNGNNFATEDECRQKCGGGSRQVYRQSVTRQPDCQQSSDSGRNCEEAKLDIKWYYNRDTGHCDRFWYRGCGGNGNNFATEDECRQKCGGGSRQVNRQSVTRQPVVTRASPICELDDDTGPCREYKVLWYYNRTEGRCLRFWYGGCQGNGNRFKTQRECDNTCRRDMIRNLHVEESTSDRIIVAWEPPQNNDVQSYTLAYMGTKYYRNTTKQDPMKEVILTPETKTYTMHNLMDGADYMINMYPDFNNGRGPKRSIMAKTRTLVLCDDSIYGCCPDGITAASGWNYEGCDSDPCKHSRFGCCEDGVSEATGPNFEGCDLIDPPSGDLCNETVYGCCPDGKNPAQGANHYGCPKEPEVTPVGVCRMKNDHGTCTDYVVKWFYNSTSGRCDRFWYGGCGGNDNRFDDEESCSRRCGQTGPEAYSYRSWSKPVCEQPRVTGPCRAFFKRYYFNGRECEQFVYGGCQGNDNNFETQEQCESTCEIDIDNTKGEDCDQLLASDLLYGDFAIKGPGRFPWQVGIRINNNTHTAPLCGGTILNSFWILSAAHCFEYFLKSELLIRVGDLNSKVTDSYEGTFEIEEIYIQPEYIIYDDGSLHNDIALLKVKPKRGRGISMDSNAQPACLPSENTVYSENLECYISGWGLTEYGTYPNLLKYAQIPIVNQGTCKRLYNQGGYNITDSMFCAGNITGGSDTCDGDSGGPLVCEINGKYAVLGVTSWGHADGCGLPNFPGVYANVKSLLRWIRKTLAE